MAFDWSSLSKNKDFMRFGGNALADLGYGMANSTNLGNAFGVAASRGAQMQPYRDQQYMQEQEQAKEQEAQNATMEWLQSQGYDDLVQMAQATGDIGAAWSEGLRRNQPQAADPFTLGAGQVRYDGAGNIIATGPEGGPETVINNNMGATDAFYDQLDKDLAGQTSELLNAGMNAQSNNIRLGQLEQVLATTPQGATGVMTQFAGSLGIPVEGLDDVQAATALINQMVPAQRPAGSGPMSDRDLEMFKASLPQIINQPGGNQKIIQTMKAINEYTIAQAEIAQRVANREITPAEGRALAMQVPNPLASFSPQGGSGSALPPGVTIRELP